MKKFTSIVFISIFFIITTLAQEVSNGLSYWQTSVVGAKSDSYALEFDGVDDYVSIPDGSALVANQSEISMCAWVYTTVASATGVDGLFGIKASPDLQNEIYIARLYGTGLEARYSNSVAGVYSQLTTELEEMEANEWIHYALVYDGSTFKVYRNGVEEGSVAATGSITDSNQDIFVGALEWTGPPSSFYGDVTVDEFTVWNKALSAEEVVEYMCITSDPTEIDSLVAYYDFNEGSGSILTDLVGDNDGTLYNMTDTDWIDAEICPAGYSVDFVVVDSVTLLPVEEASIDLNGEIELTNADGEAHFGGLDPGSFTYMITKDEYLDQSGEVEIIDQDTLVEISFIPILYYSITYTVTDLITGNPISNADVNVLGNIEPTNNSGQVVFDGLLPGNYPYNISKNGYFTVAGAAEIIDMDVSVEEALISDEGYTVSFIVKSEESGGNLEGASVDLDGEIALTNNYGVATFSDIVYGNYPYSVTLDGYEPDAGSVEVIDGNVVKQIALVSLPTSVMEIAHIDITVFPNPTDGELRIINDKNHMISEVRIYSISGSIIYQNTNSNEQIEAIDLSVHQKGVYILQLKVKDKTYHSRIVLQ